MSTFWDFQDEKRLVRSAAVVALLLAGTPATADDVALNRHDSPRDEHTLVIGKITSNPKKHFDSLKAIAKYVVARTRDLGIEHARVLFAKDTEQMVGYLRQGKVDWIAETPFTAIDLHDRAGAEFLLRRWKQGAPVYWTVFFARRDSGIDSLDDLKGKTIAFEHPRSTTAYHIPASVLIRHGLKLVKLDSHRQAPPADAAGYVFSGAEITTSTWVYNRLVNVGVFSNLNWAKDSHLPGKFKRELKIFYRSKSFPRGLELVRADLNPAVKQRLKHILLEAHRDPRAQQALREYDRTTRFDELNAEIREGIEEARQLAAIVRPEAP